jgi:hypothetical protein
MAINSLSRRDSAHSASEEFIIRGSIVSSGSLGLSEQDEREIVEIREKDAKAMGNVLDLCKKSLETGTETLLTLRGQGERIKHLALDMDQAKQASEMSVQKVKELRRANDFIPNPFTARGPHRREDNYPGTGHAEMPEQIASISSPHIEWQHRSLDVEPDDETDESIERAGIIVSQLKMLAYKMGPEIDRQMGDIAIAADKADRVGDNFRKGKRKLDNM